MALCWGGFSLSWPVTQLSSVKISWAYDGGILPWGQFSRNLAVSGTIVSWLFPKPLQSPAVGRDLDSAFLFPPSSFFSVTGSVLLPRSLSVSSLPLSLTTFVSFCAFSSLFTPSFFLHPLSPLQLAWPFFSAARAKGTPGSFNPVLVTTYPALGCPHWWRPRPAWTIGVYSGVH